MKEESDRSEFLLPKEGEASSAGPSDKVCPSCGAGVQPDMRRCSHCGERLTWLSWVEDKEERTKDPPRRDTVPHRGGLVMVLGILGLVFLPCGLVGLGLSLCAWWLGSSDLARMRDGMMDREGQSNTRIGLICAMIGTPLNILCLLWWLVFLLSDLSEAPQPHPPRFGGPPPVIQKEWK